MAQFCNDANMPTQYVANTVSAQLKSKNQVTLFVNYSYNIFYDFRSSKNTSSEQKVTCENMRFSILYTRAVAAGPVSPVSTGPLFRSN